MSKKPMNKEASVAGHALKTGKATPAQIRSMGGQIEARRAAEVKAAKPAPKKK